MFMVEAMLLLNTRRTESWGYNNCVYSERNVIP